MYYLSVVEIFGKKSPIGVYFSAEKGPTAINLKQTVRYHLVSNDSLNDFQKYVSNYTKDHIFYSAASCQYEASIYQFDTLDEIQEILSNFPSGYHVETENEKNFKISAPKVAFAQSTIPEDIYEFEIEWN